MQEKRLYILTITIFLIAIFTRFAFLGYSALNHTEAENAINAGFVLSYFKSVPFLQGLYRLWHTFLNTNNPFMQGIIFNTPLGALLGLDAFSIRLNAAVGGMISLVIIYILVRRHADRLTALFALTLLTFNPFLITFNRFGHSDSLQIGFLLGGILFLDIFSSGLKPKLIHLILSSMLFSIAFLLKYNGIVIVILILAVYHFIFRLKLKYIFTILILISAFSALLFIDQLGKFTTSLRNSLGYAGINLELSVPTILLDKFKRFLSGIYYLLRGHALYFEYTIMPLFISLLFWKKIKNKLFRFMLFFGIIYFGYLFFQGRGFYRYFQIGVIAASTAFAFLLARFAGRKHFYFGTLFLTLSVFWSIISHCTYINSQYYHIPYKDIVKISKNLVGEGNSIILYGRNAETEFYFSPDGTLLYDGTRDPAIDDVILIDKYGTWRDDIKKIRPTINNILNPEIVSPGDIVVVCGKQMDGGEPALRLHGYDGRGFRIYRHELKMPREFYKTFMMSKKMQDNFIILEKVYLTNGSKELAALILRKK